MAEFAEHGCRPVPLDRPTASDHHKHEVRITRLEVNVENLVSTVKSLQEHMDEGFKSMTGLIHDMENRLRAEMQQLAAAQQAALEALRSRIDRVEDRIDRVEGRIDRVEDRIERLDDKIDRLNGRIDLMNRWAIGLFITYLFGTVSLLARPYIGI